MAKLAFFDCNVAVGCWKHPKYGAYETADELESILDYLSVGEAVVYRAEAQEVHAPLGNALLVSELAGHPRLWPSWVVFPHFTGEMPEPHALVGEMLRQGVRMARLLPGYNGNRFSLAPWCVGPLLQELEAHRMPAFIDFMLFRRDDLDWNLLWDLCHRYPALPIVIVGWAGLASRSFYPLAHGCPNLYVETSRYLPFRGLEAFCEHVGSERLIYGSGMPHVAPGVAMTTITHASISDVEKALIASGNLRRLLEGVVA